MSREHVFGAPGRPMEYVFDGPGCVAAGVFDVLAGPAATFSIERHARRLRFRLKDMPGGYVFD